MDGLYNAIHIHEINIAYSNGKKKNLVKDEQFKITGIRELVDENEEPIIIEGRQYYYSPNFDIRKISHHFIKGYPGEKVEIELELIYAFDNEPLRTEKYTYRGVSGGKVFDAYRPIIWMFPP